MVTVNGVQMAEEYAVIATGNITPSADVVVLKSESGERIPIILGIFKDAEKAARMARRMSSKIGKVVKFADDSLTRGTPILGVQKVIVPFRQARQSAMPNGDSTAQPSPSGSGRGRGRRSSAK